MNEPFRMDLETIRRRARERMDEGAVTAAYGADRERVVEVLNEVLATEIVCTLRYKANAFAAESAGVHGESVAAEFREHATEEQGHADRVAERITQLGGVANMDPCTLATRSHSEYHQGGALDEMVRENLIAERVAVETYSEIVRWLGNDDPTSRRMMEELLAVEEEHADDLANLLERFDGRR